MTIIKNVLVSGLIFLLPFFGKIIEPHELLILIATSVIFYLIYLIKHKNLAVYSPILPYQIILILVLLISTLFSKNIGDSYYQIIIYISIFLILNISFNLINKTVFVKSLLLFSITYSLIFIGDKYKLFIFPKNPITDDFISTSWGHSYLSDILVFTVPILVSKLNKSNLIPKLLLLTLFSITLILTNSRTVLFTLIIGLLLLKPSNLIQQKTKLFFNFIFLSALIFIVALASTSQLPNKNTTGNRFIYWQQGIKSFTEAPIFGNGPGTFLYSSSKHTDDKLNITYSAHNSIISSLAQNGLVFTLILFYLITTSLVKTYKKDNLLFVCALISLLSSLLDSTWSSVGNLAIGLYFIFYTNYKTKKYYNYLPLVLFLILSLSFTSNIISQICYKRNDLTQSVRFDPFNLNTRIALLNNYSIYSNEWQRNLRETLILYENKTQVYKTLIHLIPYDQNEQYFYKIIEIEPKTDINSYIKIGNKYLEYFDTKHSNIERLTSIMFINFNNTQISHLNRVSIAGFLYSTALRHWVNNNYDKSIFYLNKAEEYMPESGFINIELANAYWHNNQKELAKKQLQICQQHSAPRQECQYYEKENKFLTPGIYHTPNASP